MSRARLHVVLAVAFALLASPGGATVYYARDEALKLAFPDADRVAPKDVFLTRERRDAIETQAKSKLDSDLITLTPSSPPARDPSGLPPAFPPRRR